MDRKWITFSKKAKVVIAGVVTSDLAVVIAGLSGNLNQTAVIIGLLGASVGPLLAYWTSN